MKAKKKQVKKKPSDWKGKRVKVYQSGVNGEVDISKDREQKEQLLTDAIKGFLAQFLLDDNRFDVFDIANSINRLNCDYGVYGFELENYK